MGKVKQIEIKNRTYYFYNDIINIEEFDSNLLKIDKKSYKDIDIYYIEYIAIKKIAESENISSVNPLYLIIGEVIGYIEENNGNKYLVFDSTDENKEVLKKYPELWDGIKNKIETINGGKKGEYSKDFTNIKFNTDDNLPLHLLTIIVSCIFEDGKFYPQFYLDDCFYELSMLEYDRIDISKEIDVNKTNASKECHIWHYWYFKDIGFKYEPYHGDGFHDLMETAMSYSDVAILYVKGSACRIHLWHINKDDAISITKNSNLIDKKGVL